MKIPKIPVLTSLVLGALAALATARAPLPVEGGGAGTFCGSCQAGVVFWQHVFPMTTSNCTVVQNIRVKDGDCILDEARNCGMLRPCKYLIEPSCSGSCDGLFTSIYLTDGTLVGSADACSLFLLGAPYCDWATLFIQVVIDPATGEAQSRLNGAYCGPCPETPVDG